MGTQVLVPEHCEHIHTDQGLVAMGWLPDHIWLAQKLASSLGGKGGGRWGKGKGKGKSPLKKFKDAQKVWVGGIAEGTTWKQLEEHMNQAAKTKWVEIMGKDKNTACVAYANEEDASKAIAELNGSALGSGALEVDVWTKKEKN